MKQLSLFDGSSSKVQPLPLEVANQYGFPLQYHHLEDDTVVYAVQDWIAGVAQTDIPGVFWQQQKKRLDKLGENELYTSCIKLPYKSNNGRTYQMDFADDKTLYSITQHMGTDTGIRNKVLQFLAESGALVDLMRQDPEAAQEQLDQHHRKQLTKTGKPTEWIKAREQGKNARNAFTATLLNTNEDTDLAIATNRVYQGVFGMTKAQLCGKLGIGIKKNPRDHMTKLGLIYTMAAEAGAQVILEGYSDDAPMSVNDIYRVVSIVALAAGKQAEQMAQLVGIDLVTGTPLLQDKTP